MKYKWFVSFNYTAMSDGDKICGFGDQDFRSIREMRLCDINSVKEDIAAQVSEKLNVQSVQVAIMWFYSERQE